MQWKSERPTEPGWYWALDTGNAVRAVELSMYMGELQLYSLDHEDCCGWATIPAGWMWQPLQPPQALKRCGHAGQPSTPHACPFQSEINDNNEPQCMCCDQCQHECCMEI